MQRPSSSPLPSLLFLLVLLLLACTGRVDQRGTEGKGGKHYGGIFNANECEELRSLFPLTLTQAASHRVAAQIYEGLVKFDQADLSIIPGLASSWSLDTSTNVYTFNIRKGVRFHDDPCFPKGKGRELSANDVVYCFNRICASNENNQMSWILKDRVVGADQYFKATANGENPPGVKGITATGEHTLRIELKSASPIFLQLLAHQGCWIYPKEMVDHYGTEVLWRAVGTGPFKMRTHRRGEALIMERNPNYWGTDPEGNQLPFLDAIRYTFASDKSRELDEFEKGNLSMIFELPVDRTALLENAEKEYQVQSIPSMSVQFYGINTRKAPFEDIRVRKAISLAIDREMLVDSVLHGLAVPATHGVVAPGFAGYPYDSIPRLEFDPVQARELMKQAGHADGEGAGTIFLQVNSDGFGYVKVAGMISSMLEKELGVRVVTTVLPVTQHFDRIHRGEAHFWREGWIVDHPDPENILELFHGKHVPGSTDDISYLNSTRYSDERFDGWFSLAKTTVDPVARMKLLARAEKQLMNDVMVVPLYHERSVRLLQPYVRDLPINGMEYRDLGRTWFEPLH